jgi:hypothetical protein
VVEIPATLTENARTGAGLTMNVYGNSTLRAKQAANSKVVQIVMKHEAA